MASGTLTFQASSSGGLADVAAVAILGETTFHVRRAGTVRIKVHLTRAARQRLAHSKHLSVNAIITFKDHGTKTSTSHRIVLKAR